MNWTYTIEATVRDPQGLHGRPGALLKAYLMNAPDTRLEVEVRGELHDLGLCEEITALRLVSLDLTCGDSVQLYSTGERAAWILKRCAEVLEDVYVNIFDMSYARRLQDVLPPGSTAMSLLMDANLTFAERRAQKLAEVLR